MYNELPILQGECAVCVLCEQPIVGDILHCAGSPACVKCANQFQSEYDAQWEDEDGEWECDELEEWEDDEEYDDDGEVYEGFDCDEDGNYEPNEYYHDE